MCTANTLSAHVQKPVSFINDILDKYSVNYILVKEIARYIAILWLLDGDIKTIQSTNRTVE